MQKTISIVTIIAFIATSVIGPSYAQSAPESMVLRLPAPGVMVHLSPEYTPAHLKGITIHPDNALKFDFLINKGDQILQDGQKKVEYTKLVKYFLASLTIPDEDQWVNLSPYEKDRIIKDDFGKTEMGRDLLAEDYMLKQITSSLIYPEDGLGKKFWNRIYERAWKEYHTTTIPVNTFNKVWIVPDQAIVYESGNTAYILKSHLKVMLEEDYLSLSKHVALHNTHTIGSQVIREIILPELEREVNEGRNFANLRQMYSGMVLATWYKKVLKESLLGKVYADKAKVKGVDQDPKTNEAIYQRYLKAFKKGVFNYIKEDVDKYSNEAIPRKYFSGGWKGIDRAEIVNKNTTIEEFDQSGVEFIVDKASISKIPRTILGSNLDEGTDIDRAAISLVTPQEEKAGGIGLGRRGLLGIGLGLGLGALAASRGAFAQSNENPFLARTMGLEAMDSLIGTYQKNGRLNNRVSLSKGHFIGEMIFRMRDLPLDGELGFHIKNTNGLAERIRQVVGIAVKGKNLYVARMATPNRAEQVDYIEVNSNGQVEGDFSENFNWNKGSRPNVMSANAIASRVDELSFPEGVYKVPPGYQYQFKIKNVIGFGISSQGYLYVHDWYKVRGKYKERYYRNNIYNENGSEFITEDEIPGEIKNDVVGQENAAMVAGEIIDQNNRSLLGERDDQPVDSRGWGQYFQIYLYHYSSDNYTVVIRYTPAPKELSKEIEMALGVQGIQKEGVAKAVLHYEGFSTVMSRAFSYFLPTPRKPDDIVAIGQEVKKLSDLATAGGMSRSADAAMTSTRRVFLETMLASSLLRAQPRTDFFSNYPESTKISAETIARSKFAGIDSIRNTILDPNNGDGVWKSDPEVNTKVGIISGAELDAVLGKAGYKDMEDAVGKIAIGDDISKIRVISQQALNAVNISNHKATRAYLLLRILFNTHGAYVLGFAGNPILWATQGTVLLGGKEILSVPAFVGESKADDNSLRYLDDDRIMIKSAGEVRLITGTETETPNQPTVTIQKIGPGKDKNPAMIAGRLENPELERYITALTRFSNLDVDVYEPRFAEGQVVGKGTSFKRVKTDNSFGRDVLEGRIIIFIVNGNPEFVYDQKQEVMQEVKIQNVPVIQDRVIRLSGGVFDISEEKIEELRSSDPNALIFVQNGVKKSKTAQIEFRSVSAQDVIAGLEKGTIRAVKFHGLEQFVNTKTIPHFNRNFVERLLGDAWVGEGDHFYKIWVEGGNVKLQRYKNDRSPDWKDPIDIVLGGEEHAVSDETDHFKVRVYGNENNENMISLTDLESPFGTTVTLTPQHKEDQAMTTALFENVPQGTATADTELLDLMSAVVRKIYAENIKDVYGNSIQTDYIRPMIDDLIFEASKQNKRIVSIDMLIEMSKVFNAIASGPQITMNHGVPVYTAFLHQITSIVNAENMSEVKDILKTITPAPRQMQPVKSEFINFIKENFSGMSKFDAKQKNGENIELVDLGSPEVQEGIKVPIIEPNNNILTLMTDEQLLAKSSEWTKSDLDYRIAISQDGTIYFIKRRDDRSPFIVLYPFRLDSEDSGIALGVLQKIPEKFRGALKSAINGSLESLRRSHNDAAPANFLVRIDFDGINKPDFMVESIDQEAARDSAMKVSDLGGIDFNSANLILQIKRDGRGVPLPMSQQDMAQLSHIQGFVPEIIEIKPAVNVPIISELQQKLQEL